MIEPFSKEDWDRFSSGVCPPQVFYDHPRSTKYFYECLLEKVRAKTKSTTRGRGGVCVPIEAIPKVVIRHD